MRTREKGRKQTLRPAAAYIEEQGRKSGGEGVDGNDDTNCHPHQTMLHPPPRHEEEIIKMRRGVIQLG